MEISLINVFQVVNEGKVIELKNYHFEMVISRLLPPQSKTACITVAPGERKYSSAMCVKFCPKNGP